MFLFLFIFMIKCFQDSLQSLTHAHLHDTHTSELRKKYNNMTNCHTSTSRICHLISVDFVFQFLHFPIFTPALHNWLFIVISFLPNLSFPKIPTPVSIISLNGVYHVCFISSKRSLTHVLCVYNCSPVSNERVALEQRPVATAAPACS